MRTRLAAAILAVLVAAGPALAAGPSAAPAAPAGPSPTAVELASLRRLETVVISPDGSQVAYLVRSATFDPAAKPGPGFDPAKPSETDQKAGWKTTTQLFVVPAGGGEPRQLTFDGEAPAGPAWAPDGKTIGFLRKKDGKARIHLLPLGGGEARVLDTGALEPHSLAFSPDGKRIAFSATAPMPDAEKAAKWASGGTVRWDREWRPALLHVVDTAGGTPVVVSPADRNVTAFRWSPDGRRFLVGLSPSSDPYSAENENRPAILTPPAPPAADAPAGSPPPAPQVRWLEEQPASLGGMEWSPDGRLVAYAVASGTLSLLNHLVIQEADGTGRWNAAAKLDPTIVGFAWTDGGKSLAALLLDRTATRLVTLAPDGSTVRDGVAVGRAIRSPIVADRAGRRLAFASSTPDEPNDPTVLDLPSRKATVLVRLNPEVARWAPVAVEVISWKSPEGPAIEGVLSVPAGAKGRLPLMVFPHGGPDWVSLVAFDPWVRFFAARGWAVLEPNYRGSLGYGHAFYAANRGRLGEIEFMDIESGVDSLVAAGRVDPQRLVYGGWSWGGYLTAWTIGHTDRYKAAVAGAAVSDVVSQYVLSDINHGASAAWEFKGNPWRETANFDRSNPSRSFGKVRTPTLILHGQADDRVPFPVGQFLYRALADVGTEVEMYAYPREPHGPKEPAHVVHLFDAWADWYARHAPPASPPAAAAPPAAPAAAPARP